MFLKGGILAEYGQKVAGPGDIVNADTIKQLVEVFKKVDSKTTIMIIKPNNNG